MGRPDTFERHTRDGMFSADRAAVHAAIIEELLAGGRSMDDPTVLLLAGGPASGKTELLRSIDSPAGAVRIDVDDIRRRLPEWDELVRAAPEQAAALTHRESSQIAKAATVLAMSLKFALVIDGVGANDRGQFAKKITDLMRAGYRVHVVYVTVAIEEAERRERARFEREGRAVAAEVLRAKHQAASAGFPEIMKLPVDSVRVYDTSTADPVLIASRGGGKDAKDLRIDDIARYDEFLRKGDPSG